MGLWCGWGISDTLISVGYVTGLDYEDPRTDPHHVFQDFKLHPFARRILEGGKMIRYGAKSLPYGGWLTMPRIYGNGWMILGDSASFLNSQRLKGIHLAIKSGMLAAETAFDALLSGDRSADTLSEYKAAVDRSWIADELYRVRNFHQGFEHGLTEGVIRAGIQQLMRGGNLGPDYKNQAGYTHMREIDSLTFYGAATAFSWQCKGRRQADIRPAHRRIPLGHAPRRRPAGAPGGRGPEYLQHEVREGVRQSLPVFLPGGGI